MLNWNKRHIGVVALLLCALALPAMAQLDTGSIVGVVRDKSGAVVPGANVKATSIKTGRVNEVKAGSAGEYEVLGVPEGTYRVEVSHSGFKTGVVSGIVLNATDTRSVDVTLNVGSTSEQVTVTAETTTVNTQTSESGASINSKEVTNLPLNGRDFTSLIALVPGSVTTGGFGQNSLGGFETTFAGVNVLLDGADATRIDVNAVSTQLGRQASRISRASVDSIEEFKVLSGTYSAEYGRSSGDIVNVITKSGGNTYHGNLFEFFRNDAMDAKNYFATVGTPLRLNQFGGNLSGPIAKDKLFFFVNYEGVRQIVNNPTGPVPVMTQATKDTGVASIAPVLAAIPDPNVSTPVLLPNPTPGGPPIPRPDLGYFEGRLRNTIREDTGSIKVDYNASSKDTFSFRYNIADSFTSTQYGIALGQVSPSTSRNHLFKATWNHTFRSNLLNEFGIAFNRPQADSLGGGGAFPVFQCVFCDQTNVFGATPGPALFSSHRPQHSLQFLDNLSWSKGKHAIRAGTDIRLAVTHDASDAQAFLGYAGEGLGGGCGLLENCGFTLSTLGGHSEVTLQNVNYGFFIQDDFRVLPRLTLNIGLRYEYNTVLHGDQIGNFSIPTLIADPTNTVAPYTPVGAGLYKPDRNNFAPRFGFAWDPFGTSKTVLRGGFGVFYSPQLTGAALSLAGNHGVQGYNVNIFEDLGAICGTSFTIAYPLPSPLPVCSGAANVNSLDPNLRDTYSMHWSFGVQQEIVRNTIFELSYVGNRGVKLPAGAAYAGEELNLSPFVLFGVPNQISQNFGQVRHLGDYLDSNYHALQASLRRHIGQGLNVDANYTWAHERDDAVNILAGAFQNSHNPKGDFADGDIDVRHNFTLGAVWDVPHATYGFTRGWQVSTLLQARSGLPVNIALSAPFFGADQVRPDLVAGQSIKPSNYSVPGNQLNIAAFANPPAFELGNLRRNAGRGPGFTQVDLGLSKTTQITERIGLQMRAELFNLFNHPNFNSPSGLLNDPNFGKSTSTVGDLVGVGTSRQAQLALKFIF
ncbi:MAG TPA: TonB-dependent receptor [Terriglobales bacterium]|nr:TonB-dependent receptor [Terriglobales bacterium]